MEIQEKKSTVNQQVILSEPNQVDDQKYTIACEIVHPAYQEILKQFIKSGIPLPEIGYEFVEGEEVIAEAEFAWVEPKVCVLTQEQLEFQEELKKRDWFIWDLHAYSQENDTPEPLESLNWNRVWKEILKQQQEKEALKIQVNVQLQEGIYQLKEYKDRSIHVEKINQRDQPLLTRYILLKIIQQKHLQISLYEFSRRKETNQLGREVIARLIELDEF
ncbi:hypothetical protein [Thermoflavimicrobium daqui]|uniref:Uncharacterized protein n=1 Tax=Thermoflavimicrobium daqui TaxID=2137476 RepID=A0A364K2H0_9BACL|nr:hypothetical protein [Thermoflavimicrobium daqui]RAL22613.1 hypothetical protein DL897_13150 [Thermoflavimicrobium daqui]